MNIFAFYRYYLLLRFYLWRGNYPKSVKALSDMRKAKRGIDKAVNDAVEKVERFWQI